MRQCMKSYAAKEQDQWSGSPESPIMSVRRRLDFERERFFVAIFSVPYFPHVSKTVGVKGNPLFRKRYVLEINTRICILYLEYIARKDDAVGELAKKRAHLYGVEDIRHFLFFCRSLDLFVGVDKTGSYKGDPQARNDEDYEHLHEGEAVAATF